MSGYGNPTGFVSFDQYLNANQEGAEEMAKKAGQAATNGADPMGLQRNVGMLQTQSGAQAFLQKGMGKGAQATGFDAALAGNAQGGEFQRLQAQYGVGGTEDQYRKTAADFKAQRKPAVGVYAPEKPQVMQSEEDKARRAKMTPVQLQAEQIRAEDSEKPGQMSREKWANLHGLALEAWLNNGMNPPF